MRAEKGLVGDSGGVGKDSVWWGDGGVAGGKVVWPGCGLILVGLLLLWWLVCNCKSSI